MTDERGDRLTSRFLSIEKALAMSVGRDKAFAAAVVAYLEGVEYWTLQALRRVENDCLGANYEVEDWDSVIPELHSESKNLLQSIHRTVCAHLGVEQTEAIELSKHFKELVDDICNKRG